MTQYNVVITSDADKDMDDIFAYIAEELHEPKVALGLVERIYSALKSLEDLPERHALSRDSFLAKQGFRVMPIEKYLAFYVIDSSAKRVIIHRVIYGKRNYVKLFL